MTLGEQIQILRKQKGLSQEQLAQILQVSRQTISKWESDVNKPELEKLKEISAFFEVSMDTLLGIERNNQDDIKAVVQEDGMKRHSIFEMIGIGIFVLVLLLSCFLYQRLSTRLDALENTLQQVMAAQGNHPVYIEQPTTYGFLEDVRISYEDIDVEQNNVTQIISFSLRTQKEGAQLWGEYHIGEQVEKIAATQTASLSYEIRSTLPMRNDITLMIIYEDEVETKSDSVPFERGIKEKAIGYIECQEANGIQWGTTREASKEVLKVNANSVAYVELAQYGYTFEASSLYVEILNNGSLWERIEIPWDMQNRFDAYTYYQYFDIDWEKELVDGDDIIMRLCLEDGNGIAITSKDFLHLGYSNQHGLVPYTEANL